MTGKSPELGIIQMHPTSQDTHFGNRVAKLISKTLKLAVVFQTTPYRPSPNIPLLFLEHMLHRLHNKPDS